jgi:fumarylacetoacetate (FAA) hydrolase
VQHMQARLHVLHNGAKQPVQDIDAQPGAALARVARLRALRAGQVVGTALALPDLTLAAGDSLHLDLKTADGASLFGAIDLDIAPDAP